jgi:DNA-binding NarL/FixJ family response regulator
MKLKKRSLRLQNWILKLMKDSKWNDAISDLLNLSDRTVDSCITNIMRKVGVWSRVTAVVIAIKEGLGGPVV